MGESVAAAVTHKGVDVAKLSLERMHQEGPGALGLEILHSRHISRRPESLWPRRILEFIDLFASGEFVKCRCRFDIQDLYQSRLQGIEPDRPNLSAELGQLIQNKVILRKFLAFPRWLNQVADLQLLEVNIHGPGERAVDRARVTRIGAA